MKRTLIAIILAAFASVAPALAQSTITVLVNGQPVTFDQPPVEQAGRVFVPLRGVFEQLGATVVYQNGQINATGHGREISLHLGSTQATVNGQVEMLDQAPFEIGARTLVPLRFVAQALGATVNWNNQNQTVAINSGNASTSYAPPAQPVHPMRPDNSSFYLTNESPHSNVLTGFPAIRATFSEPINRDSLRVAIDGRDVTPSVYGNETGFNFTAPFALEPGTHHVSVSGTTQAGASFHTGWDITTGVAETENYFRNIDPIDGAAVGDTFVLRGSTLPNSNVHVIATGRTSVVGGWIQVNSGTFQADTVADGDGHFHVQIRADAVEGGQLRLVIQSTAPGGASTERTYTYRM